MDRTKAPALTSPWKIGFFVSLLLVAMSIGVGFLITRAFNISWTWVEFGGTTWENWVFHPDAFMNEMLPLVLLVPILSQLSFFIIAGAVRKYKAYLDSGLDYKNLVHKLQQIEDLNDEKSIKKLSDYPELRDFLLNLKTRVAEREADLERREHDFQKNAQGTANESLSEEAAILASAIMNARDGGFKAPLALTIPDLKKLETAIADHLADDGPQSLAAAAPAAPASNELEAKLDTIEHEVRDIASMLDADISEACMQFDETRATAEQVKAMAEQLAATASPGAANSAAAMMDAFKVLDVISQSLKTLGEDAKGVAINTALQAGQQESVPSSEVVALADDVKNIAARFAAITSEWDTVATTTRAAISGNDSDAGEVSPEGKALTDALQNWIDGSTVFAEKLQALHAQQNEAFSGLQWQDDADGEVRDVSAADLESPASYTPQVSDSADDAVDDGFERQGDAITNPAAASEDEFFADIPDSAAAEQKNASVDEAAADVEETPDASDDVSEAPEAVEETPEPAAPAAEEVPDVVDVPVAEKPAPVAPAAPQPAEIELESRSSMFDGMATTAAEPQESIVDDDNFVTDPAVGTADDAAPVEAPAPTAAPVEPTVDAAPEDVQEVDLDEDVIDLYTLGAVDYQPENLVHNS